MSKLEKPKIVHNLEEFLEARGFTKDEPRTWARAFYRYTDCGPWTSFILLHKPALTRYLNFTVGYKNGKLAIIDTEEGLGERDSLEPQDRQAFGTDPDGKIPSSLARSIKGYQKLVEDFSKKDKTGYKNISTKVQKLYWKHHNLKNLLVEFTQEIPVETKESYYTSDKEIVTNKNCVGIKFGSIVEGSESYAGPYLHLFPFDLNDFEKNIEEMDKVTSFYWERDNSTWFQVQNDKDPQKQFFLHETWGEIKWDTNKPRSPKLKKAIEAYALRDKFEGEDSYSPDCEFHPLPKAPDWKIKEYHNESEF